MTLDAVDFSRRQAPQPRLSEPYVPGRRAARFWSEAEDAIIRAIYPDNGVAACLEKLPPRRTQTSVYQRALKLGLKAGARSPRAPARTAAEIEAIDARLREAWPKLTGRGALQRFADEIGEDRWKLSRRAVVLGLAKAHRRKEPNWSKAEILLLERMPLNDPSQSTKIFRDHGFERSPTSIMVKAARLGLSRRRSDVLSARGAAAILGVDSKWITARCIDGSLVAEKRETRRLVQQGGDTWSIQPDDLRRYIVERLEEVDIRKVDKFAFVDLLTRQREP